MKTKFRLIVSLVVSFLISTVIVCASFYILWTVKIELDQNRIYDEALTKANALNILIAESKEGSSPSHVNQILNVSTSLYDLLNKLSSMNVIEKSSIKQIQKGDERIVFLLNQVITSEPGKGLVLNGEHMKVFYSQLWMKIRQISDEIFRLRSMNQSRIIAAQKRAGITVFILLVTLILSNIIIYVISGRKIVQSEVSLRRSEDTFRHVFEAANVGKSITLPTGELNVNKAFSELLGYTRKELSNKTWQELTPPEEVETILKILFSLQNNEQDSVRFTKRYVHKNGSHIWADVHTVIQRTDDGKPLHFITTIVDITERERIKNQLSNTLSYIQTIIEKSPIGIATFKVNGQIVTTNRSLAEIIGGTVEEIVNLNIHTIESWKTSGLLAAAEDVLNSGIEKNLDFHYVSSFGKECWVSCLFVPFTHENEQQLLLMLTDISESKRAEEKSKKLQDQLQQAQKMESIGRLAGGVAHDYNNALTVIMGYTELAMMDEGPKGPLHADLNLVLKAGRHAQDITRQLLAFARKQTIAPVVLDLNRNVESMLKMLRRLIGEDIDLAWLPGKDLGNVKMDPSQIDQILANLCVNAKDAIDGVGRITIETENIVFDADYCAEHSGFFPGRFVLLAVSDNGCGMDKEIQNNIFEPFFTTKPVDKGTGLGLSTIYGIVKQNKGFINVYSEPDKGTAIKIYLTLHGDEAVEIQRESTAKIPQGQGETILLVEDDLSILKLAEKMLKRLNYTVLIAGTPKRGIKLAEDHTGEIHLLVTDVIMPEMNGLELSKQLKLLYSDLKCIFMSGYTANAIAHHGVLDKGVHFVQKPFAQKDLASIVRKVLDEGKS